MEDYKDKFYEQIEQIFFLTRDLTKREREEEKQIDVLNDLGSVIQSFIDSVESLQGARKQNALNTIEKLKSVHERIGSVYLSELYWRKKHFKAEKALLEAADKIKVLENQIKLQNELNLFEKD